jgi:alginate O-acetyltransferase complex protein AlgI
MLFNSFTFQLLFLPVVLSGNWLLKRVLPQASIWFLIAISLMFYGWSNPKLIALMCVSIAFNFLIGNPIYGKSSAKLLSIGIFANLGLLAYFKYYNWFALGVSDLGLSWVPVRNVVLPLAISFFTFEQISYLIDCKKRRIRPADFAEYAFFVSFFPKLIAGPIVRFSELQPQLKALALPVSAMDCAAGCALFILGFSKKVLFADQSASIADPVFSAAASGTSLSGADAWLGSLAYTFQIYFDFSGYTDMALGLALLFGLRLPLNFMSPYKSTSIIEFWRRWHMTLSRFLRDYLYIPLGGSKLGPWRTHINLMIVMLLGGLWHGAGLSFIAWGGLHGLYLIANHLFRKHGPRYEGRVATVMAWLLTFVSVVIAWVLFRAGSFPVAISMFRSMFGLAEPTSATVLPAHPIEAIATVLVLLLVCLLPNTSEIIGFSNFRVPGEASGLQPPKRFAGFFQWRPNVEWGLVLGLCMVASTMLGTKLSPFVYFQF